MADLRVLYFPQDRPAEVREIADTLPAMQSLVGGFIEAGVVLARCKGVSHTLMVNEEGLLHGMRPNVALPPWLYRGGSVFVGPCFVTATDAHGDSVSLTPDECEGWRAALEPHRACRIVAEVAP